MIRNQSNCLLNIVKRSAAIGLCRPCVDGYDSRWFTLASTIDHQPIQLLNCRLPFLSNKRTFCDSKVIKCWQCGSEIGEDNLSISCSNCLAPQLNDQRRNYFTQFDQTVQYDVHVPTIRQRYLSLQRVLHPDKFTNRSKEEQEISSDLSTYVNKAYRVLINPYERGIYLLQLKGIYREERDGNFIMEPEFLEDMLTINEAVLESKIQGLPKIRANVESKVNTLVESISKGFQVNALDEVELSLNKLKFYVNILDKITQKE